MRYPEETVPADWCDVCERSLTVGLVGKCYYCGTHLCSDCELGHDCPESHDA